MKKGQIFSMDFMFSFGIFLTILFITIAIWENLNIQIDQYEKYSALENKLIMISNLLVKTGGSPQNWEQLNLPAEIGKINSIGLADGENMLNPAKISKFVNLNQSDAKSLMGISGYDFCIEISNSSGDIITINGKGMRCNIPSDVEEVHSITRSVVLEDDGLRKPVLVNVAIWGQS